MVVHNVVTDAHDSCWVPCRRGCVAMASISKLKRVEDTTAVADVFMLERR